MERLRPLCGSFWVSYVVPWCNLYAVVDWIQYDLFFGCRTNVKEPSLFEWRRDRDAYTIFKKTLTSWFMEGWMNPTAETVDGFVLWMFKSRHHLIPILSYPNYENVMMNERMKWEWQQADTWQQKIKASSQTSCSDLFSMTETQHRILASLRVYSHQLSSQHHIINASFLCTPDLLYFTSTLYPHLFRYPASLVGRPSAHLNKLRQGALNTCPYRYGFKPGKGRKVNLMYKRSERAASSWFLSRMCES